MGNSNTKTVRVPSFTVGNIVYDNPNDNPSFGPIKTNEQTREKTKVGFNNKPRANPKPEIKKDPRWVERDQLILHEEFGCDHLIYTITDSRSKLPFYYKKSPKVYSLISRYYEEKLICFSKPYIDSRGFQRIHYTNTVPIDELKDNSQVCITFVCNDFVKKIIMENIITEENNRIKEYIHSIASSDNTTGNTTSNSISNSTISSTSIIPSAPNLEIEGVTDNTPSAPVLETDDDEDDEDDEDDDEIEEGSIRDR